MHPTDFFDNVRLLDRSIRIVSAETDVIEKLKAVHPRNFISTEIVFQIAELDVSYETKKGNRKTSKKYSIQRFEIENEDDPEMVAMIQAEADIHKYNTIHRDSELKNFKVENARILCMAVLRIE